MEKEERMEKGKKEISKEELEEIKKEVGKINWIEGKNFLEKNKKRRHID